MFGSLAVHGGLFGLLLLVPIGMRLAAERPASEGVSVRLAPEAARPAHVEPLEPAPEQPVPEPPVPPPAEPKDPPPAAEIPDLLPPPPSLDPARPLARPTVDPVPSSAPPPAAAAPVQAAVVEELVAAQVLERIEPRYPPGCLRRGHGGVAVVRVTVGLDGLAHDPTVVHSAGCDELDQAALEVVTRFRFAPAARGGVPLATAEEIAFKFVPR